MTVICTNPSLNSYNSHHNGFVHISDSQSKLTFHGVRLVLRRFDTTSTQEATMLVKSLDVPVRDISLSIFRRVQAQSLLNGLLLGWHRGRRLTFFAGLNLVSSLFLRTFAFSRRNSYLVLVK